MLFFITSKYKCRGHQFSSDTPLPNSRFRVGITVGSLFRGSPLQSSNLLLLRRHSLSNQIRSVIIANLHWFLFFSPSFMITASPTCRETRVRFPLGVQIFSEYKLEEQSLYIYKLEEQSKLFLNTSLRNNL